MENAVNPETSSHALFFGFNVNVCRLFPDGAANQSVDQPDYLRSNSRLSFLNRSIALFFLLFFCRRRTIHRSSIEFLNRLHDFGLRREASVDVEAGHKLELIESGQVKRIGHRNCKPVLRERNRKEFVLRGKLARNFFQGLLIHSHAGYIDPFDPRILR